MMTATRLAFAYTEADPAMALFAAACERFDLALPAGDVSILELGCAETDFLDRLHRQYPSLSLTGVDCRRDRDPNGWTFVQASAMTADLFAPASFDAILILGALEHFGLGWYGDPKDPDGDIRTMENVARWLRSGGWVYFDVPCNPVDEQTAHYRTYASATVGQRLIVPGLRERARGYSFPEPQVASPPCSPLGVWIDEPTTRFQPYHFVAVVADKLCSQRAAV